MKQTRQQLADRVEVLESILRTSLLKNLRTQFVMECEKNANLKKTLAEETAQKQHWEDCAGQLMEENQQLRHGIPPTDFENMLKKKNAVLEKKLGEHPFGIQEPPPKDTLFVQIKHWWRETFNI